MALHLALIPARRRGIALAILVLGLGASLSIYFTAPPASDDSLGLQLEDSKQYLRQLEYIGGKSNVLAGEFSQWFNSLWHGQRLAVTVAVLTILAVLFYLFASTPLSDEASSAQHFHPHDHTK